MFTLQQIEQIHNKFGNASNIGEYLQQLHKIGVVRQDSFIADGHSEYYNSQDQKLASAPMYDKLTISKKTNEQSFKKHLDLHNQGRTSYIEMSQSLAESGIEKWTFDTVKMTITYLDKQGMAVLVEPIV